ncbi:hypothetical protein BDV96DRAFT_268723 [Lophiotrema nucula]|uniref:Uncharacterized protein n=1 Tax=Lophiotrema nucula TaxID=690887 RepID=A0A6A5ZNS6_9PLEO|nr:hypothetical protein BDV96DRAFT_268723 [Lophiotrema nucula]
MIVFLLFSDSSRVRSQDTTMMLFFLVILVASTFQLSISFFRLLSLLYQTLLARVTQLVSLFTAADRRYGLWRSCTFQLQFQPTYNDTEFQSI